MVSIWHKVLKKMFIDWINQGITFGPSTPFTACFDIWPSFASKQDQTHKVPNSKPVLFNGPYEYILTYSFK